MFGPRPFTPSRKANKLSEQIRKLQLSDDIEAYGPKVVEIFEAAGFAFTEIDEHEGYWKWLDGRFYMVRSVRNHPVWGPRLFKALALTRRRRRTP